MRAARRIKTADEIGVAARSARVAEDGLAAAVAELRDGTTEAGADRRHAGGDGRRRGEHVGHPGRRVGHVARPPVAAGPADRGSPIGDLVAFAAGALADGYVGEVGRTWPVGDVARRRCAVRSLECAVGQAGRGMPARRIRRATCLPRTKPRVSRCRRCRWPTGSASGSTRRWSRRDLPATSAEERLDPGTVLAVTGYVWEEGVGAVFRRDAVLVTDDGAEVLTASPSLAQAAVGIS